MPQGALRAIELVGAHTHVGDERHLGEPERDEDLPKEPACHAFCRLAGAANIYPTPRTVLMRFSASSSPPPSFLRNLLTCTSTLRSNGASGRPKAVWASSSRVTTVPALRSSNSKTLNSTLVRSTSWPPQVTVRVPWESEISPTVVTSSAPPFFDL